MKRWERKPERHNGRCRACGRKMSAVIVAYVERYGERIRQSYETGTGIELLMGPRTKRPVVPCCGTDWPIEPVRGKLKPERECNAKCQNAIGKVCECACAGANHGASHAI